MTTKRKLSDMTGYEPDNVMIVQREEYEALKTLNAELLTALKLVRDEYCEGGMLDGTPAEKAIVAAIAKAEGR